ncbi:MAG: DNA-binding protein [Candidatus Helarchaeota archaeon]
MTVDLKARVLMIQPPRTVRSKRGTPLRVCEAILGDATGRIPLTLWQKQIYLVKVGDVVEISKGYATEFQGITKITLGREGRLNVVEDSEFPSLHDLLNEIKEDS